MYCYFCLRGIHCSSLLVRVLPAAKYRGGQAKQAAEFPEDEWVREEILVQATTYAEGILLCSFFSDSNISRFENSFTRKIPAGLLLPCCAILTHSLETLLLPSVGKDFRDP